VRSNRARTDADRPGAYAANNFRTDVVHDAPAADPFRQFLLATTRGHLAAAIAARRSAGCSGLQVNFLLAWNLPEAPGVALAGEMIALGAGRPLSSALPT
jgi:hypothetical protein